MRAVRWSFLRSKFSACWLRVALVSVDAETPSAVLRPLVLALVVNRCSIEYRRLASKSSCGVEFGHGLELLMLVLETAVSSNSLRLMTETFPLWSDGFKGRLAAEKIRERQQGRHRLRARAAAKRSVRDCDCIARASLRLVRYRILLRALT